MSQLKFLTQDVKRIIGKEKYRLLYIWMNRNFWGTLLFRLERGLYLMLGKSYRFIRIFLIPHLLLKVILIERSILADLSAKVINKPIQY